ncbi:MAG: bifunctional nuclease family protein [Armatimonadetes bacterium]|nr:bifunctional nuclease family protein [Armatimonadota bacterium]
MSEREWDEEGKFDPEDLKIPSQDELMSMPFLPDEGETGEGAEVPEMEDEKRFSSGKEVEVKVVGVFEHAEPAGAPHTFVVLRDHKGRQVPISIGRTEAYAISLGLSGEASERPLTHDLLRNILERLDVNIDRIVVDDLWRDTFYAKIYLVVEGEEIEIDSRPSDAIALAIRFRCPIYMSDDVIASIQRSSNPE